MRNILSLKHGTPLSGKEIKAWIQYHIKNNTSYYREAIHMEKYLNIDDNKTYSIYKGNYQESERWYHVKCLNDEHIDT